MKPNVLDISHHNTVTSFQQIKSFGINGIIHKASQGDSIPDKTYSQRRDSAVKAGLLWGAYHFASNEPVKDQVDWFFKMAQPSEFTLLALDYEPNGSATMSLSQAREFIERVDQKTGHATVLYSGNLIKETLDEDDDGFWGNHPLWLAQYGPKAKLPDAWDDYFLWQFSDSNYNNPDNIKIPGISGQVDMNYFNGDASALSTAWVQKI
jgi:GH25 family lysozyme M1 (1,4-beta-N-acetylmuramidase)